MKAINNRVRTFLEQFSHSQVISLGAGFDTLYFRSFDQISSSNCQVFDVGMQYLILFFTPNDNYITSGGLPCYHFKEVSTYK